MNTKSVISFVLVLSALSLSVACASKHTSSDPAPTGTNNPPPDTSTSSSSGDNTAPPVDAGNGSSSSSSSSSSGSPPPVETLDSCVKSCADKYPTADQKDKTLTACMLGPQCVSVCDNLTGNGKEFPPADEAGIACDTAKAGSFAISTPSADCSSCLAQNCCAQWISLYADPLGQELNSCAIACFNKYSK